MRVEIRIQDDDLNIEVSDETEAVRDMALSQVLAEWWDNGTPTELIEKTVARAIAAYKEQSA